MILFTPDELLALQAGLHDTIGTERCELALTVNPEEREQREAVIARCEALIKRIDNTLKAVKEWTGDDAAWCGLIREAAETALEATATANGRNAAFSDVMQRMDEEMMP